MTKTTTDTDTTATTELVVEGPSKWTEREWLLTIALTIALVVDAVFSLGIDFAHWAGLIGVSGSFTVSRGLAKRGAARALPLLERATVAAKILQADDEGGS